MCSKSVSLCDLNIKTSSAVSFRVCDGHFVFLSAAEVAALRAEVVRLAAELRPGRGEINVGITPRSYCERVERLDTLRKCLAVAEEAAEVIA